MAIINILIADDEPNARDLLAQLIASKLSGKIQFVFCESGEESIEVLSKNQAFDLICLDWNMGRKNGGQVIDAAKQFSIDPQKIILVTGSGDTEQQKQKNARIAREKGAAGVAFKPFLTELIPLAMQILNR